MNNFLNFSGKKHDFFYHIYFTHLNKTYSKDMEKDLLRQHYNDYYVPITDNRKYKTFGDNIRSTEITLMRQPIAC